MAKRILKKGTVLNQTDIKTGLTLIRTFDNYDGYHPAYLIQLKDKKYLIQRSGNCEPKKCESACCNLFSILCPKAKTYDDGEPTDSYFKQFSITETAVLSSSLFLSLSLSISACSALINAR